MTREIDIMKQNIDASETDIRASCYMELPKNIKLP